MNNDLKHLPAGDWLGDHSERAWAKLLEMRGGCSCHVSPPCGACTEPISEEELNSVGFTYEDAPS
jgi:hypothetical protein